MTAHSTLFVADSLEKTFEADYDTVENYLENQLIYAELNHYKKHGEILGKHPIFSRLRRIEEIRGMKVGDLVIMKIRLDNNLVRNRKKYRDHPIH